MLAWRTGRYAWSWVSTLLVLLLTAGQCAGPVNSRPVADAGPDQTVIVGETVVLDAASSRDDDGDSLTIAWSFATVPDGSAAALSGVDTLTPSFVADVAGSYVVTLSVFDGTLLASDSVSVVATAEGSAPSVAPIEDQTMFAGDVLDVPLTLTDEDPDGLTIEVTSDDQTLVADGDLVVLGSGAARTLRVTPAPLGEGSVVINVLVRDAQGLEGGASFGLVVSRPFETQLKLTAFDAAAGDLFGRSVAISNGLLIVGAPEDDDDGTDSGSAYVFGRSGDGWVHRAKLPPAPLVVTIAPSSISAGDRFGESVAISGNDALVGAPGDDDGGTTAGAAYVYERCDSTFDFCDQPWREVGKLTAGDATASDVFGGSVAISGDHLIVGARGDDSAYLFRRDGDQWLEVDKVSGSDTQAGDLFGSSVAISGDYAVVGAAHDDVAGITGGFEGSAYLFERRGDNWVEVAQLFASDAGDGDFFGLSLTISGDHVIVGAVGDGFSRGAAYVFERSGDDWLPAGKLIPSDADLGDDVLFGSSVSVDGDFAVIAARGDDLAGIDSGAAYVFRRGGTGWLEIGKLTAGDAAGGHRFGSAVAISGDFAIIGAFRDDHVGAKAGSAYVFQR